jgi:hypothetical protein
MRAGISTARSSTAEATQASRGQGTFAQKRGFLPIIGTAAGQSPAATAGASSMHSIIYIVGLIVVVLAILSFLGLR